MSPSLCWLILLGVFWLKNDFDIIISIIGDVSDLAGRDKGDMDGMGSTAKFMDPVFITQDLEGYLWVSDTGSGGLRKIIW